MGGTSQKMNEARRISQSLLAEAESAEFQVFSLFFLLFFSL